MRRREDRGTAPDSRPEIRDSRVGRHALRDLGSRASGRPDWPGRFALAWAIVFGLLYAEMLLRSRAPGLLAAIRRSVAGG